jgi:gamma-glutamylputrescine oxidase
MQLSYWERVTYFDNLHLLIVGSGIIGLCTAIEYKKLYPSRKVLIVERGVLPCGASTKNAGFACFGSVTELISDLKSASESLVWETVGMRIAGLNKLKALVGESNLNYESVGGYEVFADQNVYESALDQLLYFNKTLYERFNLKDVYAAHKNVFGFGGVHGIIGNQYEGALDTGKMMQSLLQIANELGVLILHGLEVSSMQDDDLVDIRFRCLTKSFSGIGDQTDS